MNKKSAKIKAHDSCTKGSGTKKDSHASCFAGSPEKTCGENNLNKVLRYIFTLQSIDTLV